MKSPKDQTVLITGSNSGIGHATAKLLAQAGYITYGGARRAETFSEIEKIGVHPLQIDMIDETSMAEAVKQIETKHGAVDVLINNAGFGQMGPIEEITTQQWQQQYQTNVFGLVRLTQLVLPAMREQRSGRIINLSSMGGQFTFPLAGAYHSTKYALESINEALRFEVKSFGIDVIVIQPAAVATPLAATALETIRTSQTSSYQTILNAFYRTSEQLADMDALSPEDVAQVILGAVQSRRPKPRYKIGRMARLLPIMHTLLSDRLWDRLLTRFYS
jgi:NAD(P)-dependent dehydrogenase (short-subunit alcohol dehydrogenase family)